MIDLTGAAGNEEMTGTSSIQMLWAMDSVGEATTVVWELRRSKGFLWVISLGLQSSGMRKLWSILPVCTGFSKRSAVSII